MTSHSRRANLGRAMRFLLVSFALGLGLAIGFLPQAGSAQAPAAGQEPYEWKYRLPIWGNRLAARGIAFPLPLGVGLNYAWLSQPVTIDKLKIAINDGEFVDLDQIVEFERVDAKVHAVNARLDVWLFPFINVYGLLNYAVQANTDVVLSEPFALNAGATQPGGGGGLGTTLAMGAWGFFATLDFNWTRNKMQKLDAPVNTFLVTPRIGRRLVRIGKFELTAWVGAMFQRIGVATQGKIRLSELGEPSDELRDKVQSWYDGLSPVRQAAVQNLVEQLQETLGEDPTIRYRLDKQVSYPWNMVAGAQLEITENWLVRVEAGFIKRTQVVAGLNYRFGIVPAAKKH